MSHQPFETWLFADEELTPQKNHTLASHLQDCEDCRKLSDALHQVTDVMASSKDPLPVPGFTQRWQQRLIIHRHQKQQRRMWLMTIGLFAIAGFILTALLFLNHQTVNWVYELSQFIANFSLAAAKANQAWSILQSITGALPILIPIGIVLGFGLLSAMSVMVITWIRSLVRLYKPIKEGVQLR